MRAFNRSSRSTYSHTARCIASHGAIWCLRKERAARSTSRSASNVSTDCDEPTASALIRDNRTEACCFMAQDQAKREGGMDSRRRRPASNESARRMRGDNGKRVCGNSYCFDLLERWSEHKRRACVQTLSYMKRCCGATYKREITVTA
jgi:hypothetical protein